MSDVNWNQMNPMAMWRDWVVKSEAQWSDAVAQMMKNEQAGPLLTRQVDEARMLHRQFGEMAQASLAAVNLPSRTDFEALDERMGRLEDGLAQLSAEIATLVATLSSGDAAVVAFAKPLRDRKPPKPQTVQPPQASSKPKKR